MGSLTSLGKASKTTYLAVNPHKIYVEFEAAAIIKNGQPVKLDATGKVTPWAKTEALALLLGYAYTQQVESCAIGETVTVITRGNVLMFGMVAGDITAGPATWASYDAATADADANVGYNKYELAAANTATGWILDDPTGAGDVVRVLLV